MHHIKTKSLGGWEEINRPVQSFNLVFYHFPLSGMSSLLKGKPVSSFFSFSQHVPLSVLRSSPWLCSDRHQMKKIALDMVHPQKHCETKSNQFSSIIPLHEHRQERMCWKVNTIHLCVCLVVAGKSEKREFLREFLTFLTFWYQYMNRYGLHTTANVYKIINKALVYYFI